MDLDTASLSSNMGKESAQASHPTFVQFHFCSLRVFAAIQQSRSLITSCHELHCMVKISDRCPDIDLPCSAGWLRKSTISYLAFTSPSNHVQGFKANSLLPQHGKGQDIFRATMLITMIVLVTPTLHDAWPLTACPNPMAACICSDPAWQCHRVESLLLLQAMACCRGTTTAHQDHLEVSWR